MEKMPLLGAPGYYCALGYWMAAVLFGYENKRKHTAGITVLLQIVFLVCIIIFSVVTDTNLAIYFLPCFAFAILLLFLMLYLTCEMPLNNICYFTIRSFILGEFTSSLEWQLEIYFREKIAPGNTILFSAVFLLAVHSGSGVIVNLFEKRYKESNFRLHIGKKELAHASLIAVSFFLFSNISNIFKNTPFSSSVLSEILLIRTLVTLGGVIMLYAYHMQLQDIKDKLEIQMLRQTMDAQYANYQMSEQSVALINQKYHDLKHQIEFLKSDISSDEKMQYLNEMEQDIQAFEAQNHTGNHILDTILTAKSLQCQNENIQLTCVANGKYIEFMNPMDISALFGNMLDNAIEGVSKVEEKDKRWIHVSIRRKMDFLVICVSNSYQGTFHFLMECRSRRKRINVTMDMAPRVSGILFSQYGGTVVFRAEKGWFEVKATYDFNSLNQAGQL